MGGVKKNVSSMLFVELTFDVESIPALPFTRRGVVSAGFI